MKKTLLTLCAMLLALSASAQDIKMPAWLSNVKLSGYGMTQYQYSGKDGAESNTFQLRLLRVSLEGRIANDFYWKTQVQINGNTSTLGSSPRVVDLFAEWQKYDFFRVKIGQFKNPFTFDNPLHPMVEGFYGYTQLASKFAGFSDRAGVQASNGRDIGLQFQGDFLKNANGRNLLHYQIGVFNGQGINVADVDQQKNLIGGIWVMPIKGMRIGAFGWTGSYARKGTWNDEVNPQTGIAETKTGTRRLQQRRYAFSADYVADDWTFRTEYAHGTGKAFAKTLQHTDYDQKDPSNCNLSGNGDKADAFYAQVIAPIIKEKFHAKARYDLYRANGEWNKAKTNYEIGLDYIFAKRFMISGEYILVNDRSLADHNYSMVDIQVDFKF